jgi:hypothetical protein
VGAKLANNTQCPTTIMRTMTTWTSSSAFSGEAGSSKLPGFSEERPQDEPPGAVFFFSFQTSSSNAFCAGTLAHRARRKGDFEMIRLAFTALALAMGTAPVLAADTSTQPPTANTTSPEASQSATVPPSGSADTSGGATEQSSSPPSAGSTMGKMGAQGSTSGGQTTPNPSSKMGAQGPTSGGQTTPNPTAPGSND